MSKTHNIDIEPNRPVRYINIPHRCDDEEIDMFSADAPAFTIIELEMQYFILPISAHLDRVVCVWQGKCPRCGDLFQTWTSRTTRSYQWIRKQNDNEIAGILRRLNKKRASNA